MRNAFRLSGALLLFAMLLGAAGAQDWPQWLGPQRDAKAPGFQAPKAWPKTLAAQWKVTVGAGDATPALVGDRLYVFTREGNEEVLRCLDIAAKGQTIWMDKYAAQAVSGPSQRHPGPRSSPAVAEGKVVTLGVAGLVSCLDAASGKLLWRRDDFPKSVPKFFTACSPLIVDGMAIVHLGGATNGALVAYDLATGEPKWKWAGEGPGYDSPNVLTAGGVKQIVELTDKSAIGVAASDGKLLWQLPFEPKGMSYNAATPIVDGETVIIAGQGRGTRALKIEKTGEAFNARELWSNPQLAPQYATPVLKDGMLYGLNDKGFLYCMSAADGKQAWMNDIKRGGAFGALVDAGPVILALPSTSELIAYKPNPRQYEEVALIKVAETPTYAFPVVSGNRVFIKDQDSLAMFVIK